MDITIDDGPSDPTTAEVIAQVLARHLGRDIQLDTGDGSKFHAQAPKNDASKRNSGAAESPVTSRETALLNEIQQILEGGPERGHEKLEQLGKLFVRDRLDQMFDEILYEDGTFARYDADEQLPGDAIVTGAGRINGRKIFFAANDYTVKAGTFAEQSIEKLIRIQEDAIEARAPVLYLIDSSGGRIDSQSTFYADRYHGGRQFFNQCIMSGRVPQIAVLYGPDFAGTAYQPVFCDFLVMVEDISAMAIASPRIVEIVTGQETSIEELGGPAVHASQSGSADFVVEDEQSAIETVHRLLRYLPQSFRDHPKRDPSGRPRNDPTQLDTVIPDEPNKPYDIYQLLDHVIDANSFLEVKPQYGPELVTGFAALDGRSIGVVANQPAKKTGAIYPDSSEKAAGFIWLCDAYNIPLLFLCDTPGFMVGKQVERDGILQKGRRFIYATSCSTVPKISVIVRKAYGAGTYAMAGPSFDTDSVLALPSAQIAVMGPKAAINAVHRNKIDDIDDTDERERFVEKQRAEYRRDIDIRKLASEMVVDELVLPRDLRTEIVNRFEMHQDNVKERPDRKHGVMLF